MAKLYLDDGGNEDGTDVFGVAGYLATEDQWTGFESMWTTMLTSEPYCLTEPFHMTDCLARKKQFDGWSCAQRDKFLGELLPIIPLHDPIGVGYAIGMADFRRIIGPAKMHAGTPIAKFGGLAFCLYACLLDLSAKLTPRPGKEEIAVVCEKGTKRLDAARSFCKWLIIRTEWGSIYSGITDGPKSLPGLQAADVLANQTYSCATRYFALPPTDREQFKPNMFDTPWLRLLSRQMNPWRGPTVQLQYFDETHFTHVVRDWNAYRIWSG